MRKTLCFFGGYGPQYWLNIRTPDIEGKCDGITVCSLDDEGKLIKLSDIHGIDSPATLAVSPGGKFLYAANELNNFKGLGHGGGISSFSFDEKSNKLKILNQVSAAGSCTAYIAIDKYGKYLFVANHGSYYYVARYEIGDFGQLTS